MGNADQHADRCQGRRAQAGAAALHLFFRADAASVRRALATAMAVLRDLPLDDQGTDAIELVLAEALNNVVEHAYAERDIGLIELEVMQEGPALAFRISDEGREMPQGMVPRGAMPDLDVSLEELPEGGFGWFLIHEITDGLSYRRQGPRNILEFRIAIGGGAAKA